MQKSERSKLRGMRAKASRKGPTQKPTHEFDVDPNEEKRAAAADGFPERSGAVENEPRVPGDAVTRRRTHKPLKPERVKNRSV